MTQRTRSLTASCFALMAIALLGFAKQSLANSNKWDLYTSKTELFNVLFPNPPDEIVSEFRIGDGVIAYNTEAVSFIDQRPYKDVVKTYVVKMDQTLGQNISKTTMLDIAERELKLYEELYAEQEPKIIDRFTEETVEGFLAGITLTYNDTDGDLQGMRVALVISKTAKFHQIFTGPAKDLDAEVTHDYFDSLDTKNGYIPKEGSMNEDWRHIESPMGIFSLKIPRVSAPYFMQEPTINREGNGEKESIGMVFTDPIWSQNLFYNVTGYKLDSEIDFDLAQKAILEKHMKRHGRGMVGIRLHKDFIGETPFIETSYAMKPPAAYPYVNFARVRGMFLGNYLMVQEVVGPKHLIESRFTDGFYDLIEFTPKKAFQKAIARRLDLNEGAAVTAE